MAIAQGKGNAAAFSEAVAGLEKVGVFLWPELTEVINTTDSKTYLLAPGLYTMASAGIFFDASAAPVGDICVIGMGATPDAVNIAGATDASDSRMFYFTGSDPNFPTVALKVRGMEPHLAPFKRARRGTALSLLFRIADCVHTLLLCSTHS